MIVGVLSEPTWRNGGVPESRFLVGEAALFGIIETPAACNSLEEDRMGEE